MRRNATRYTMETMSAKGGNLLLFHGAISFAAFLAISFFNGEKVASMVHFQRTNIPNTVDVGIEHTLPISLTIDVSTLDGASIVEVTNTEGGELAFISVPDEWQRREVRNASIADVTSEESSFGFTRWKLPAGATISYRSQEVPESMVLHNPSKTPVKAAVNRVDLQKNTLEHDIILVQDASALLW